MAMHKTCAESKDFYRFGKKGHKIPKKEMSTSFKERNIAPIIICAVYISADENPGKTREELEEAMHKIRAGCKPSENEGLPSE